MTIEPHKPKPHTAEPSSGDTVLSVLGSLSKVQQMIAMYPDNHPAIHEPLSQMIDCVQKAGGKSGRLTIVFAKDHVIVEGTEYPIVGGVADWVRQMKNIDLAGIELAVPPDVQSILECCRLLSAAINKGPHGEALATELACKHLTGVKLLPIDYRQLNFTPASSGPHTPRGQSVWDQLVHGGAPTINETLEKFATEADHRYKIYGSDSIASSLVKLENILEVSQSDNSSDQREFMIRLARTCTGLNPDLGMALLSIIPEHVNHPEDVFLEIARNIPSKDMLNILNGFKDKPSTSTIRVLKALSVATDAQGQIDTEAYPQADSPGDPFAGNEIENILSEESGEKFVPDDYLELLERTAQSFGDRPLLKRWPYRSPDDSQETQIQVCEIALFLLDSESDEVQCTDHALKSLRASLPLMIQCQRFDLLADIYALCKSRYSLNPLATELVADIGDDDALDTLIALVAQHHELGAEACQLFVEIGSPAVLKLITLPVLEKPHRLLINAILAGMDADQTLEILQGVDDDKICRLTSLLEVLAKATPTNAISHLHTFCGHPSLEIRRNAYTLVNSMFSIWPLDLARAGIVEEDPDIRDLAHAQIKTWNPADRLSLFSALAQAELRTHQRVGWEALTQLGEAGLQHLSVLLEDAMGSRAREANEIANELADFLGDFHNNPTVRKSLRRWRWSLSRLLANIRRRAAVL